MKSAYNLLLLCLLLGSAACKKENRLSGNKITNVSFSYSSGEMLSIDGTYIDDVGKRIFIHPLAFGGANKDIYEVRFDVSPGATTNPVSGTKLDLSTPVTITVTAEDGSKQEYKIVRSLVELQTAGRVPQGGGSIGVSTFLRFAKERGIFQNATKKTFNLILGKIEPDRNGVSDDHFSMTLVKGTTQSENFTGTYTGSAISDVAIKWSLSLGYGTIDADSKVVVTAYDPVMKMYSGTIEHLQSTYESTPQAPTSFIRTTGYFENIPLVE
ncbi:MAG: DUF5018 domain-containing protein [Cytophagales bacterium]|jgi:hypothetical protein|nr:DUF5018 domain-containing protein [Cytophagales bacterium]